MLGEGTLSSAFVPVFTDLTNGNKEKDAWKLLNQVLTRLFFFVGSFSLLVILISFLVGQFFFYENEKWMLGSSLNSLTFGYGVFICSSAIVVGALNVKGRFFEGAVSPIILNLCLIFALLAGGYVFSFSQYKVSLLLAGSVLLAAMVQLSLPWQNLKRMGWQWNWDRGCTSELLTVQKLFWVGAMGAAVTQINVLVSRFLAYSLDDSGALSSLYISARLVELPLGVFAIAISTVLFPGLAKTSSSRNSAEFGNIFLRGIKTITWITLPAAFGLSVLSELVVRVLFEWNEFGSEEVRQAAMVLKLAAWSIPLYAYTSFLVKAYHAKKEMHVPFRAALISMLVNLLFSLILLIPFGIIGLVWANLISCFIQLVYLTARSSFWSLSKWFGGDKVNLIKCSIAGLILFLTLSKFESFAEITGNSKGDLILELTIKVVVGMVIYFLGLLALGVLRIDSFQKIISK